jgi:hypothetical protein
MQQMPPNPPSKKGSGRSTFRTPPDPHATLFSTGKHPVAGDSQNAPRRTERGARIADVKRALFFAVVLVFVAIVLYQFVTATAL